MPIEQDFGVKAIAPKYYMSYYHRVVNMSYALRHDAENATDGSSLVVASRY